MCVGAFISIFPNQQPQGWNTHTECVCSLINVSSIFVAYMCVPANRSCRLFCVSNALTSQEIYFSFLITITYFLSCGRVVLIIITLLIVYGSRLDVFDLWSFRVVFYLLTCNLFINVFINQSILTIIIWTFVYQNMWAERKICIWCNVKSLNWIEYSSLWPEKFAKNEGGDGRPIRKAWSR